MAMSNTCHWATHHQATHQRPIRHWYITSHTIHRSGNWKQKLVKKIYGPSNVCWTAIVGTGFGSWQVEICILFLLRKIEWRILQKIPGDQKKSWEMFTLSNQSLWQIQCFGGHLTLICTYIVDKLSAQFDTKGSMSVFSIFPEACC